MQSPHDDPHSPYQSRQLPAFHSPLHLLSSGHAGLLLPLEHTRYRDSPVSGPLHMPFSVPGITAHLPSPHGSLPSSDLTQMSSSFSVRTLKITTVPQSPSRFIFLWHYLVYFLSHVLPGIPPELKLQKGWDFVHIHFWGSSTSFVLDAQKLKTVCK